MDAPPAVQPFPLPSSTDYSMAFRVLIVSAIPVIIMLPMCFFFPRISSRYNDHHRLRRHDVHFELRSHDTERVRELMEGLKRAMMEASDGFVYDKLKGGGINRINDIDHGGDNYSSSGSISSIECAICLDDFKDGDVCKALRECDHVFHKQCAVSWLMKSNTCPICRAFIPFRLSDLLV